ncbi:hypothetical protein DFJ73DRAFT_813486 [Zopfochytrium polystomum]|nr:hypothetical protein DFJ73DRAFT_813486 [Zopfochytrium polystomum]
MPRAASSRRCRLAALVLVAAIVVVLGSARAARAHYQVTSPTARPFVESLEVIPPCGGQPLGARTTFPIDGGVLAGQSYHATATANISVAFTADPILADFAQVLGPFTVNLGNFKTPAVSLTKTAGAAVGRNVTVQMTYFAGDGLLYQCVDAVLTAASSSNSTTTTSWALKELPRHNWLVFSVVSAALVALFFL